MLTRQRLTALVRVVLVAVGLTPFVAPFLARFPALEWFVGVADGWFGFQCERDPERMLGFGAVCARCLGVYAGVAFGALGLGARLGPRRLEIGLVLAVVAMLADVASEALGWRPAWAPLRVGTGLLLGVTGTAVFVGALRGEVAASAEVTTRIG